MGLKLRYISQKFKGSLLRFSSVKILNLELNFEFSPRGSGSNFGSEPNFGNTIANSGNSVKFCSMLGDEVAFKTRAFNVLAFNVPLTIDTNNSKHREEINEANGLEENAILVICWAKPANRRSPNQRLAHLVLSFSNPEVANRIISSGITICNKKCHAEHMKQEPIRCLRCQGWNHLAGDCVVMISKCSNCAACAEHHMAEDCNDPRKRRCISCNVDGHASWSRECPTFLRKVKDYNLRNPNNLLPFFPFPTHGPGPWVILMLAVPLQIKLLPNQWISAEQTTMREGKGVPWRSCLLQP